MVYRLLLTIALSIAVSSCENFTTSTSSGPGPEKSSREMPGEDAKQIAVPIVSVHSIDDGGELPQEMPETALVPIVPINKVSR